MIAIAAESPFWWAIRGLSGPSSNRSFKRPMKYWPAVTPLIGPVRM